jgi:acid phosphatase class B
MNQPAIIIDLDGTLVNNSARAQVFFAHNKYEDFENQDAFWNEFFKDTDIKDTPNDWCMDIVNKFAMGGHKILFITGRGASETTKAATERWLMNYVKLSPTEYELIMRPNGDNRPDEQVKLDILTTKVFPRYSVLFAIDDKKANIDLFRHWGIPALHCADY